MNWDANVWKWEMTRICIKTFTNKNQLMVVSFAQFSLIEYPLWKLLFCILVKLKASHKVHCYLFGFWRGILWWLSIWGRWWWWSSSFGFSRVHFELPSFYIISVMGFISVHPGAYRHLHSLSWRSFVWIRLSEWNYFSRKNKITKQTCCLRRKLEKNHNYFYRFVMFVVCKFVAIKFCKFSEEMFFVRKFFEQQFLFGWKCDIVELLGTARIGAVLSNTIDFWTGPFHSELVANPHILGGIFFLKIW